MTDKFKRRGLPNEQVTVVNVEYKPLEKSNWGERFQFGANAAQVLMLILVAFGYWYTVLPVFQHQELQEQNAKLRLNNAELEKLQEDLGKRIQAQQFELEEMRQSHLEGAWRRFVFTVFEQSEFYDGQNDWVDNASQWSDENLIMTGRTDLDPYWQIRDVIHELANDIGDTHPFLLVAREQIDANKEELQRCPRLEFKDLVVEYRAALSVARSNEERTNLRNEYSIRVFNAIDDCEGERERFVQELIRLDLDFSDEMFRNVNATTSF